MKFWTPYRIFCAFMICVLLGILVAPWPEDHPIMKAQRAKAEEARVQGDQNPEIDAQSYERLTSYLRDHPVARPVGKKYMEDGKITVPEYYAICQETARTEFQAMCEHVDPSPP